MMGGTFVLFIKQYNSNFNFNLLNSLKKTFAIVLLLSHHYILFIPLISEK